MVLVFLGIQTDGNENNAVILANLDVSGSRIISPLNLAPVVTKACKRLRTAKDWYRLSGQVQVMSHNVYCAIFF